MEEWAEVMRSVVTSPLERERVQRNRDLSSPAVTKRRRVLLSPGTIAVGQREGQWKVKGGVE